MLVDWSVERGRPLLLLYARRGPELQPKKFRPSFFPRDVFFADTKRGWIVGDDGDDDSSRGRMLFITNNAGDSWEEVDLGLAGRPSRLHFLEDGRRGWLIEQRLLARPTASGNTVSSHLYSTTDGGLKWEQVAEFRRDVDDLCVLDAQTLFVAGGDGFASRTTDGGQTWQRLNTRCRGFINSVQFYDKGLGLLLSDFGVLLLTRDGGETWQRITDNRKFGNLFAAVFLSKSRIILASSSAIYNLEI